MGEKEGSQSENWPVKEGQFPVTLLVVWRLWPPDVTLRSDSSLNILPQPGCQSFQSSDLPPSANLLEDLK